jgi:hypothetical protein
MNSRANGRAGIDDRPAVRSNRSGTTPSLTGHVPAEAIPAAAFGRLPATRTLNLAIGPPLRNQAARQAGLCLCGAKLFEHAVKNTTVVAAR